MDAIERLAGARLDEQTELLAHHALRGERWPAAVTYARAAGQKAIGRSAHREALGWFEQVLTDLKHLPDDRHALELAVDVRLDMRLALMALSGPAQQLEYLREAEEIAVALGDRRRQAGVRAAMTGALSRLGRHDEAIDAGQQALDLAEQMDDHALRAFTLSQLVDAYRNRGDLRLAANAARRCIDTPLTSEDLQRFAQTRDIMRVRSALVWILGDLGDFDEAIVQGLHNIRSCEEHGDPSRIDIARNTLARTYLERGDVENAMSLLDISLPRTRALDDKGTFAWALALRGALHTLAGQSVLPLPLLQECLEVEVMGLSAGYYPIWASRERALHG